MPPVRRPRTDLDIVAKLARDVEDIKRRLAERTTARLASTVGGFDVTFTPVDYDFSTGFFDGWDMPLPFTFTVIVLVLQEAGSTATTVNLRRDAADVAGTSASIGSGVTEVHVPITSAAFLLGENIGLKITAKGTGAKGLHVSAR